MSQDDDQITRSRGDAENSPIDRRKFIKVGSLSAAALAAGCAKVVPETGAGAPVNAVPPSSPSQPGQVQPIGARPRAQAGPGFHRNYDPVPATEPSMSFAAFT